MGFGVFQLNIKKWDQWKENSKYLIPYDDSDLTKKAEEKTLRKAMETIESVSSLKFVKYDMNKCLPGDPCSWYLKFIKSKKGFYTELGRNKKSGNNDIKVHWLAISETKYHFYVIHEVC